MVPSWLPCRNSTVIVVLSVTVKEVLSPDAMKVLPPGAPPAGASPVGAFLLSPSGFSGSVCWPSSEGFSPFGASPLGFSPLGASPLGASPLGF